MQILHRLCMHYLKSSGQRYIKSSRLNTVYLDGLGQYKNIFFLICARVYFMAYEKNYQCGISLP